jgi:hypothetical protein
LLCLSSSKLIVVLCRHQQCVMSAAMALPASTTSITSTHFGELNLPDLPISACLCHIFPSLTTGSLLSIGQLCDHGCTANFTATQLHIHHADRLIQLAVHLALAFNRMPSCPHRNVHSAPDAIHVRSRQSSPVGSRASNPLQLPSPPSPDRTATPPSTLVLDPFLQQASPADLGPDILTTYESAYKLLLTRGFKPQLQRLDNEASKALLQFMSDHDIDTQLSPPHVHR